MQSDRKNRNDKIKVSIGKYHRIFNSLMRFSEPVITDEIPTAAVVCTIKDNKPLKFMFNPEFFDALDDEQLEFVYCHEMMHIICKHAMRSNELDKNIGNIAKDIVINEYLLKSFMFNRANIEKITETTKGVTCTYERYFDINQIKLDQNFEYYYNLLIANAVKIPVSGEGLDSHDVIKGSDRTELQDVLDKALGYLNIPELEKLKEIISKTAGQEESGKIGIYIEKRKAQEPRLERFFKASTKEIKEKYDYEWRRKNLKMSTFYGTSIKIPFEAVQDKTQRDKKKLYAFIDTSGSCDELVDRFMSLIDGIDLKNFEVKLYGFNTEVYEIINRTVYSGGTKFGIIEEFLLSLPKYPDNIFMITDGEAYDTIQPLYPNRWVVFLTEDNRQCFLNADKITFNLI